MKPPQRALLDQVEIGIRMTLARFDRHAPPAVEPGEAAAALAEHTLGVDVPLEFQRRMAAIIEAVQSAIWNRGIHEILGYATDFALGQQRGVQTLVLKTRRRSAYVRLHWDTLMGDSAEDRQRVDEAVRNAISELA